MLGVAIVFIAVVGWIVMALWNALVPALFHAPLIEYWQAVGLLLLTRILFGGMRGRGGWGGHWRQRMWRERWEQMTPEERERLREKYFAGRCGQRGPTTDGTNSPPSA